MNPATDRHNIRPQMARNGEDTYVLQKIKKSLSEVAMTGQETFVAFGITEDRDQLFFKAVKILGQTTKYILCEDMAGLMRDESRSSSQVTGRTFNCVELSASFNTPSNNFTMQW
jgi:hypothetical protein